jgi:hypothetical protein
MGHGRSKTFHERSSPSLYLITIAQMTRRLGATVEEYTPKSDAIA